MNFQTLSDYMILPRDIVSVKKMNNIYELCYVEHRNTEAKIKKLNEATITIVIGNRCGGKPHFFLCNCYFCIIIFTIMTKKDQNIGLYKKAFLIL